MSLLLPAFCHLCQSHAVLISAPQTARACWLCGGPPPLTIPPPLGAPWAPCPSRRRSCLPACALGKWGRIRGPPGGGPGSCPGRGEVGQLGRHRVCNAKKGGFGGLRCFFQ